MSAIAFVGDCYVTHEISIPDVLPDTIVLNWEHAVCAGEPQVDGKVVLPCERAYYRESFGDRHIVAGLANNHVVDFGLAGLAKTAAYVRGLGYDAVGALDAESAEDAVSTRLKMIESGRHRIALLFYAHVSASPITSVRGVACVSAYEAGAVAADIATARAAGADVVVCVMHWGAEEVTLPPPEVVRDAHRMIDAGADLIVGHHAHVVHGAERYRGKPIFYGLGNFYFPHLSVPVAQGGVSATYTKIQSSGNTRSLAVILDTETLDISSIRMRVDLKGRAVTHAGRGVTPRVWNHWMYEQRFRVAFVVGKLLARARAAWAAGRRPGARAIVNAFRLATQKTYR